MFRPYNLTVAMHRRFAFLVFLLVSFAVVTKAQKDTATLNKITDSSGVTNKKALKKSIASASPDTSKKRTPAGTAALLSAIIPGAGQVYNKKYWKVPLVYGVLAIPTYTFVDNLNWFKKTRLAFNIAFNKDTARYDEVDPRLIYMVKNGYTSSLQNYRDDFRRNVDYSALVFLLVWGLNVVDATVDAHLKDFNITDDLSLQLKPGYMPIANTAGIGIVLNIGKNHVNRSATSR